MRQVEQYMVYSQRYSRLLFHSGADRMKENTIIIITVLPLCTQMMFELIKNHIRETSHVAPFAPALAPFVAHEHTSQAPTPPLSSY